MSYLNFLLIFIGLPLLVMVFVACRSKREDRSFNIKGIFVLIVLATLYTTPWDNYLLAQEVWWYGAGRVIGTLGLVPYEEYGFFVFQTLLTGFWTYFLMQKWGVKYTASSSLKGLALGLLILSLLFLVGVAALFFESSYYLGLILAWALPIVLLQFAIGGRYLLSNIKVFIWSVTVPTLYLWACDYYAIANGIWEISSRYTLKLNLGGVLPLEEMVFFLVTNIMVAQGLILFNAMKKAFKFLNLEEAR